MDRIERLELRKKVQESQGICLHEMERVMGLRVDVHPNHVEPGA